MATEIERKFLVNGRDWQTQGQGTRLVQGYLSSVAERTVRVRIDGEQATLNIKGKTEGATRSEWEYPIPVAEAEDLLSRLCEQPLIDKIRYRIPYEGFVWEVDEFFGENAGLVVAEVELESEDQTFEKPDWLGEEVTHDARYYNSNLIKHPFSTW